MVGVVIIGILIVLASPAYKFAAAQADRTGCQSNLRQIYVAAQSYTMDNSGMSLPAQTEKGSQSPVFWHWSLRPYLGAESVYDETMDDKVRCPAYDEGSNHWAWGYGQNSRPGYEGTSTTGTMGRFNWLEIDKAQPANWKGGFSSLAITHPSRRLFICDAIEWQVVPSSSTASFPDYDRHGQDSCNVLFYDGHIEALDRAGVNKALYDPGS